MTKYHSLVKRLPFLCVFLLFSSNTIAKSATVHLTINNFVGSIGVYNPSLRYHLTKEIVTTLNLDKKRSASYSMNIEKPTFLILYLNSNIFLNFSLFLTPGDEIFLNADFSKSKANVVVTGKGSNNNQPDAFALTNMETRPFKGDLLPNRVLAAINKKSIANKSLLTNYIKKYKPSTAFIKMAQVNLTYFVPSTYYEFNHNNNFGKSPDKLKKWQQIQDSIFSTIKLNNSSALIAYNYTHLIDNFILRETENLGMQFETNPKLFFKQWYNYDLDRGLKFIKGKPPGILDEKIIDTYFTGNVAQYAYSWSLKHAFHRADYSSTILVFNHFKEKYPKSIFLRNFQGPIIEIIDKQRKVLNSKAIFLKNNGKDLNTLKEVLALTKGKVTFIDMWGTWCGPCREELEKNTARLSTYFRGKSIVFIYIANFNIAQEKEWKKQIAYFQLEGVHILANSRLTKDIMDKVKGTGYPTYIIAKKDGSYKQTVTKYPVNIEAMIKEIDAVSK